MGSYHLLVGLMFALNCFIHGTQDLYPKFLEKIRQFTPHIVGMIGIITSIGALLGGIFFGTWSERIGRRRAFVIAALLPIPFIPLWSYSHPAPILPLAVSPMQFLLHVPPPRCPPTPTS